MRFSTSKCFWYLLMLSSAISQNKLISSFEELESLVHTHGDTLVSLHSYIQIQEQLLDLLKRHYKVFLTEHEDGMIDSANYFSNPINIVKTFKRLRRDYNILLKKITHKSGSEAILKITSNKILIRLREEYLRDTINAITTIQYFYDIDIAELSEGKLNGIQYSSPMTASEYFEIAIQIVKHENCKAAEKWFIQALNKLNTEKQKSISMKELDIFYIYCDFSFEFDGDSTNGKEKTSHQNEKQQSDEKESKDQYSNKPMTPLTMTKNICKKKAQVSPSRCLQCYYVRNKHSFLYLAPLKLEEYHKDPYVVLYHNVIYENEIMLIKELAEKRFHLQDARNYHAASKLYRSLQLVWIDEKYNDSLYGLNQRISDMTSLNIEYNQWLQVIRYRITKQEPHHDYLTNNGVKENYGSNIATLLFYLTDVIGGSVVFPLLGVKIEPEKGAAVFWQNLDASGEVNQDTLHATCPLLTGDMWTMTKYIPQFGQELLRPCNL